MNHKALVRGAARWSAAVIGVAASAYGTYVGITWYRYGHASPPSREEHDPLLDRFIPTYEITERHQIRIAAPAGVTLAAARETDLQALVLSLARYHLDPLGCSRPCKGRS